MPCSRLGRAKVVFAPYSNDQIAEIVRERLAGLPPVFEPFAIKLAARKVSNVSGDVRRALEVLRLAAELAADAGDGGLVTSARVSAAYAAMFEAAHMQARRPRRALSCCCWCFAACIACPELRRHTAHRAGDGARRRGGPGAAGLAPTGGALRR